MRISDWSSDVCSSDLRRRVSRERTRSMNCGSGMSNTRPASRSSDRSGVGGLMAAISSNGASSERPGAALLDAQQQVDVDLAGPPALHRLHEAPQRVLQVAPGRSLLLLQLLLRDQRQHAHDLRSEEHTSELQSLMRISYAVFC